MKINLSSIWSLSRINSMSSIGVGIQKIAIHSQLIGLKTALKISDIMKKSDEQD